MNDNNEMQYKLFIHENDINNLIELINNILNKGIFSKLNKLEENDFMISNDYILRNISILKKFIFKKILNSYEEIKEKFEESTQENNNLFNSMYKKYTDEIINTPSNNEQFKISIIFIIIMNKKLYNTYIIFLYKYNSLIIDSQKKIKEINDIYS